MMTFGLAGRVGIITGASRGIGAATARILAAEGMRVVLAARSADAMAKLAESFAAAGGEAAIEVADLSAPGAAERCVATALDRFGRLDLVVNNAGATKRGDFLALTDADWADGFGLVRASNTTPVLVLRFEGQTSEALARIQGDMMALLREVKPDAQVQEAAH